MNIEMWKINYLSIILHYAFLRRMTDDIPPPPPPDPQGGELFSDQTPAEKPSRFILGNWRGTIRFSLFCLTLLYTYLDSEFLQWCLGTLSSGDSVNIAICVVLFIIYIAIAWTVCSFLTSDYGVRILISIIPTVLFYVFCFDYVMNLGQAPGEASGAIVIVTLFAVTVILPAIIYWILSKSSVLGTQCGKCGKRGKLWDQQIDKKWLGEEWSTVNGESVCFNKYLATNQTTCASCGDSWTWTAEIAEKKF